MVTAGAMIMKLKCLPAETLLLSSDGNTISDLDVVVSVKDSPDGVVAVLDCTVGEAKYEIGPAGLVHLGEAVLPKAEMPMTKNGLSATSAA